MISAMLSREEVEELCGIAVIVWAPILGMDFRPDFAVVGEVNMLTNSIN
jgi:hypothetical protein